MASVWRAEHLTLGSPVAVKFVAAIGVDSKTLADRFVQEARVAASVRHRNVVEILDFGVEQQVPYMVMEFLEGESLADRIDREELLPIADVAYITSLLLRGLAVVHDAGIVHRDLKPENVFLVSDADGMFPKLLDFGVSRKLGSANLTQQGMLVGTPHYMSPEQARGMRDLDPRTDLYSLGVIMYEALTGTLPFDTENPGDLIIMVNNEEPAPIAQLRPELPGGLAAVVEQAMAKDRKARFQTAREMRTALTEAVRGLGFAIVETASGLVSVSELPPSTDREIAKRISQEVSLDRPPGERVFKKPVATPPPGGIPRPIVPEARGAVPPPAGVDPRRPSSQPPARSEPPAVGAMVPDSVPPSGSVEVEWSEDTVATHDALPETGNPAALSAEWAPETEVVPDPHSGVGPHPGRPSAESARRDPTLARDRPVGSLPDAPPIPVTPSRRLPYLLGALALVLVAAGAAFALRPALADPIVSLFRSRPPAPPPEPPPPPWRPAEDGLPEAVLETETDAGAAILLRVAGLPADAEVRVDGLPVSSEVELPVREESYRVEVWSDGEAIWRVEHPADRSGEYVPLEALDAGVPDAAATKTKRPRRRWRPRRRRGR